MSAEDQEERIKNALQLTFVDLNHLHEVTGLFSREIARFSIYQHRALQLEEENATLNKSPLFQAVLDNEEFDTELLDEIRTEYNRLLKLSPEDLQIHVQTIRTQRELIEEAKRPYNRAEAELVDVGFWVRKSIWTPEEAILLFSGKEPNDEIISYLNNMNNYGVDRSEYAVGYFQILELMKTAIQAKEISTPGTPLEFLGWFEKIKFDVSDELRTGILEIHAPQDLNAKNKLKAELSPVERETLLKLVAAMAVKGYRFDPEAKRNEATSDILNDLDYLGRFKVA